MRPFSFISFVLLSALCLQGCSGGLFSSKGPVTLTEGLSLQEYLMEQLRYRNLSDEERKVAEFLVGSIDENGYLRRDMESISDDVAFSLGIEYSVKELERLLSIIHQLEPAGIGARNLQECLLLQMNQRRIDTPAKQMAQVTRPMTMQAISAFEKL